MYFFSFFKKKIIQIFYTCSRNHFSNIIRHAIKTKMIIRCARHVTKCIFIITVIHFVKEILYSNF